MSHAEVFDVFNEDMVKIGEDTRENVHAQGLWHQTFHCWILNRSGSEDRLLLQLRNKDKDTYPNLLDVSCAGHLLRGESVEDGVRELEEELGIVVPFEELVYCGTIAQEDVISDQLIDREFNHVFVYECGKRLDEYRFQTEEIAGLFTVATTDLKKLLSNNVDSIPTEGVVIDEGTHRLVHERRRIQINDLTPNTDEYYNMLFEVVS